MTLINLAERSLVGVNLVFNALHNERAKRDAIREGKPIGANLFLFTKIFKNFEICTKISYLTCYTIDSKNKDK